MINSLSKLPLESVLRSTLFLWGWFLELLVPGSLLGPKGQAKCIEVRDPLLRGFLLGPLSGASTSPSVIVPSLLSALPAS